MSECVPSPRFAFLFLLTRPLPRRVPSKSSLKNSGFSVGHLAGRGFWSPVARSQGLWALLRTKQVPFCLEQRAL